MHTADTHSDCISPATLRRQNRHYRGSGGRSQENRQLGLRAAFLDTRTGTSYLSRFADGSPAPCHLLDGLPGELIAQRDSDGSVAATRPSVIAGFLRGQRFYTREEAVRLAA